MVLAEKNVLKTKPWQKKREVKRSSCIQQHFTAVGDGQIRATRVETGAKKTTPTTSSTENWMIGGEKGCGFLYLVIRNAAVCLVTPSNYHIKFMLFDFTPALPKAYLGNIYRLDMVDYGSS